MRFFHQYQSKKHLPKMQPARPWDRIIAQLVDGLILWVFTSVVLFLFSGGAVKTIWVSPVIPVYILQVVPGFVTSASDYLWGGSYIPLVIPYVKTLFIQLPSPLLWLIYASYYSLLTAKYGQTPGKMLKGLVVLNEKHQLPGVLLSLKRWLATIVSLLTGGIGLAMAGPEGEKPALHDRLSATAVYHFSVYE